FGSLILVFPVLSTISYLLELWLKEVPLYTIGFLEISLLIILINAASEPMRTIVQATGNIKKYQIIISSIIMSIFPIVYIFFEKTNSAYYLFWIILINTFFVFVYRLWYLINKINLEFKKALSLLILPCVKVIIPCVLVYFLISNYNFNTSAFVEFLLKSMITVLLSLIFIYF